MNDSSKNSVGLKRIKIVSRFPFFGHENLIHLYGVICKTNVQSGNEYPFPLFENLLPFSLRGVQKHVGREWNTIENAVLENGDRLRL